MSAFQVGDRIGYILERAWRGNKPFESCIPEGTYECVPYSSARFPNVIEVKDVPDRDHILIHPANYPNELSGCLAPGKSYTLNDHDGHVWKSRQALADLVALERFVLVISSAHSLHHV